MKQSSTTASAAPETDPGFHEIQLESVLDAVADGCLLIAVDGAIRYANTSAENMFGYTREELLALDVAALVPLSARDGHRRHMADFASAPRQRPMSREQGVNGLRRDGSEFPVEVSLSPLVLDDEPMTLALVSDVTERKRVEEALRECDRLSAQVITAVQEGVIVYGLDQRYQVWNPFMEALSGLSASDVLGRYPLEVFPFLEGADIMFRIESALAGETPADIEFPFKVKQSGRSGWVSDRTMPLRNEAGGIVGAIATVTDISEMRTKQEEMRLAHEFFETTFAAAPVAMALLDSDGRYIRVNPAMSQFVGYTEAELMALTYMDITHPDDLAANIAARKTLLAGEASTFRMEKRFIHKDGRAIWALLVVSLVTDADGKPQYSIGQMLDIDKRKQMEHELCLSEQRFRSIFENTTACIAVTDGSGNMVAFNEAFRLLLGYDADTLKRMNFADFSHPRDIGQQRALIKEILSGRRDHYRTERCYLCSDGKEVTIDLYVSVIRDDRNRVVNLVGVMSDITEHKRIESSLLDSRRQLRDLAVHQEDLLESERKHIAGEIHDELGQLLTALKMDMSLLRLSFGTDPELAERVDEMKHVVERTIEVVRQVSSHLRPAALDLGLVAAIEWLAEDFFLHHRKPCQVKVGGDEPALDELMATAIFRIVQESLTNIARHAAAEQATILVNFANGGLQLRIIDDGCGFDPTAARQRGFGLFAMRERMLALGGVLSIASEPGLGTTVAVELSCVSGNRKS